MKQFSYWKGLLCAVLMLVLGVTFTACSDNDTEDDKTIPEIKVTQSLTFDGDKTETQELKIELNGNLDWKIDADAWIEIDRKSGKGSATVPVTVAANATQRTGTITVTATGYMGATATGKCTVKQAPGGVIVGPETNVAEIRRLTMEANPSDAKTDLPEAVRAMTLTGIVVSDKGGGNQQPFILVVADNTQEGGAGVALALDEADTNFERGDVVSVSLSDAKSQLFNGLLQISTFNTPALEEHVDPLQPIVITADKIAEYESQYVKIEQTQPEASESGTWNDSSNKGNVSMETKDGKSYKIRTVTSAVFGKEAIPTDKSGSMAGIAGIFNTTLQLMPCTLDDIQLTEARFTVDSDKATLAEALAAAAGSSFEVEGATVVGANEQGVLLQQGDALVYAFKGDAHGLVAGDVVTVAGKTESRNGLLQFGKGSTLEKTGHNDVTYPQPAAFGAAEIEAYMKAPEVKYVTYTGNVLIAGDYVNVEIEGTSVQGSLDYMSADFKEKYNGHNITITGWLFGSYKTFMYTIPVEIVDKGEFEEEVPEGAIFYSTFDKELATQSYGSSTGWPYLDEFDGWINHKGSGVANVTYDYKSMSVRTNQSSKGSLSNYEGSGKNNMFFSTAPTYFTIEKIDVQAEKLRLSFGVQRYAQGANNTFIKSDFIVRLSADGQTWSQMVEYDFDGVQDVPGEWRLASADFTLPAGTKTLYIKFEAKYPSVSRIDDVLLVAGQGGQEIVFGAEEELPISTIAQIIAGEMDKIYKAEGQVIAIHDKGFLVKDDTGIILVFKKKHGAKVGDMVTIEGATSEYGGLKQFGETTELKVNGNQPVTQPQPITFAAADFEAYVKNPTIKYIEYVGDLTSVAGDYYQYYYHVSVKGTGIIGNIAYPLEEMDILKYVDRGVKITGYAIGSSGTSITTMATSIALTEEEPMPDEKDAITVTELNKRLATMSKGDALGEMIAVKGYVAANNEGGNFKLFISLVDNTGAANSGIIIKGADYNEKTLPVGTKVIVSLKYAQYNLSSNLPVIERSTIFPTAEKATIVVPEITVAQAPDYVGQYVTIMNLTPAADATTWIVDNKGTSVNFTDDTGAKIIARTAGPDAVFANEKIAQRTANLSGIMEIYKKDYQLFPTSMKDVAGFKVTE